MNGQLSLFRPARTCQPRQRPFDFAPVAHVLEGRSTHAQERALHVSPKTLRRYKAEGLTVWQADRAAVRLGYHPANLWPQWWTTNPKEDS